MTGRARDAPSLGAVDCRALLSMSSRGVDDEAGSRRWAHGSGACGLHRSEGRTLHGRRRLGGDLRQPRSRRPPLPRGIALPLDLADLRSARARTDRGGTGAPPLPQLHDHYGLSRRRSRTRRPRRPGAELAATAEGAQR